MRSGKQGGFTLVELMVSMAVGGVLLSFVLSSGTRMSAALRAEHRTSELATTLSVARGHVAKHLRNAGYRVNAGFSYWDGSQVVTKTAPLEIVNGTSGSDKLRLYYASAEQALRLTSYAGEAGVVAGGETASTVTAFDGMKLAVLVNPSARVNAQDPVTYDACVVTVTGVDTSGPMLVHFAASGAMNTINNPQCAEVEAEASMDSETVLYPLVARSFRVSDIRLQMSPSGELLANDWSNIALGVVNLQIASRWLDPVTDPANPTAAWLSGSGQSPVASVTSNQPTGAVLGAAPAEVSLSIEVRSIVETTGVPTATSGDFSGAEVGDWSARSLPSASPYDGNHIYRSSTTRVDLRNLAVGIL